MLRGTTRGDRRRAVTGGVNPAPAVHGSRHVVVRGPRATTDQACHADFGHNEKARPPHRL
jgi:hypothetical protein